MRLRFGDWSVGVDEVLLTQAGARCTLEPFRATAEEPLRLVLQGGALAEGQGTPLDPRHPSGPRFRVEGERVRVELPQAELDTELALRVGMQLATLRQGGLLLHAAAVAFQGSGVVAVGPSGAGKSTFTRLCARAAQADVLSDEVVALYPGGRVEGSPFCSELDLPSSLARARLAAVLLLAKGPEERMEEVSAQEAIAALMGQVFRPLPGEASSGDILQRLARITEGVRLRRFVFRKDEAAAAFVKRWLDEP
ncbi:potassium transporter TrkH [Hyalangium minutum]|uniref:Putative ATP-binding membrane transport protein n=1 Tax=Hyalangium minutum TaxID=394096 RepID=A0A085W5P2_9BACT|nr:potassium transporter TrkH [Hyalangium minutum]KFE63005.1 putative ATP-binding membrane transport protein [Hyalangium minutum]